MKYKIARSTTIDGLEDAVQFACDEGWEPFGIITERHTGEICQVVVKHDRHTVSDAMSRFGLYDTRDEDGYLSTEIGDYVPGEHR